MGVDLMRAGLRHCLDGERLELAQLFGLVEIEQDRDGGIGISEEIDHDLGSFSCWWIGQI
ncbi:hypothetical protein [Candidatus Burkholderia verschuerenii]|uniref:hypothetical protein n=1 Tax=Candidatus Burkholderia verschuerenii TaxID=242163 RepID=UPI0009FADA3F|nr:hypothetical protein [Candidatus Burkholderia verschuerenii]